VTSYAEIALNPRRADQATPLSPSCSCKPNSSRQPRPCYAAAVRAPETSSRSGPCTS
jgi:hypothetical protein